VVPGAEVVLTIDGAEFSSMAGGGPATFAVAALQVNGTVRAEQHAGREVLARRRMAHCLR
jgi:shikimate kinase